MDPARGSFPDPGTPFHVSWNAVHSTFFLEGASSAVYRGISAVGTQVVVTGTNPKQLFP